MSLHESKRKIAMKVTESESYYVWQWQTSLGEKPWLDYGSFRFVSLHQAIITPPPGPEKSLRLVKRTVTTETVSTRRAPKEKDV